MFFLDFFFPKKCLGCGKKRKYFCDECVAKIELIERPICPVCQKPSPFGQTHPYCRSSYKQSLISLRSNKIDGLTSVFVHKGIIREGIKQLKYHFRFDLAEEIVTLLLNSNKVDSIQFLDFKKVIIVSVPLHRWRQDWRGFNQATLLAKILAKRLKLPFCEDLLIRKHYTRPQTGLKKEERQANVENAFKINSKFKPLNILISKYPNIVLFDDVWTTGATMKTCTKLLKRAGFKQVWGLTIAR